MRLLRPALVLIVVLIAGLSWWLRDATPREAPATTTRGERIIDYHVTGLDVVRMTAQGKPAHRLVAQRAQHFVDDDTTQLLKPRLTVFQDQSPPWEIDADDALVSADGELVLLNGAVLIERAGDADDRPMRIVTRNLRVQPGEDYAETDEKVRVRSQSDWLDATGMQAWLRPPSRLKFLSEVTGFYVPDPATQD